VDTLSISGPMTLLVLKAHEMYRSGAPMEEVAAWLEANKLRAQAFFTVDDLMYLKRGGRISSTAAAMGTMLDLKPVITETREGKLNSVAKLRGRKKAINYLLDQAAENIVDPKESMIIVLNADAPEEAEKVRTQLLARMPEADVRIYPVGPVIGAHCGPGTVAICFLGKERAV